MYLRRNKRKKINGWMEICTYCSRLTANKTLFFFFKGRLDFTTSLACCHSCFHFSKHGRGTPYKYSPHVNIVVVFN